MIRQLCDLRALAAASMALVVVLSAGSARATTINFDDLPATSTVAGLAVPAASQLTSQYAGEGVLFSSLGGFASVVNFGPNTPSSPNAIAASTSDGLLSYAVPIEITFVSPNDSSQAAVTDYVSIRGDNFIMGLGTNTMIALDINGNPIDFDVQIEPPASTLTVSGLGIHKVILIGSTTTAFDDLTFNSLVPVPEPSSIALGAMAIAAIGLVIVRSRKTRVNS
jgi:hypothetical protein